MGEGERGSTLHQGERNYSNENGPAKLLGQSKHQEGIYGGLEKNRSWIIEGGFRDGANKQQGCESQGGCGYDD